MKYEYLGYAGATPFVAAATALMLGFFPSATANALVFYSVIILSFLGGVHWGVALVGSDDGVSNRFTFAILPSLAAWAVFLMPFEAAFVHLAFCFLAFWLVERYLYKISSRYQRLRNILTAIVISALTIAFIAFL
ncbi:MAG: DUF3429 domain-containing protein [Marinicaulis sp.]|nr:DUF3429 domain-containing protein [Marinicaulis sp.]NNE41548.1 DUF3429 domain-containing protein [Marinicaulis sp.]NNL88572.1 DUF3429 domain-containing protein [Marinicaulis sp.]